MGKSWENAFLDIRDKLTALHHGGLCIHHRLIASSVPDPLSHCGVQDNLSIELDCTTVQERVRVNTPGLAAHEHLFYCRDHLAVERLAVKLEGLAESLKAVPLDVLPHFRSPNEEGSAQDLGLWMAIVMHIAWKVDAIYLKSNLQYMYTAEDEGTECWSSLKRPVNSDPRDWMVHQLDSSPELTKRQFEAKGLRFPGIVFSYFDQDVLVSSVAAIDVLLNIVGPPQPDDRRRPKRSGRRVQREYYTLLGELRSHHNFRIRGEAASKPLTQKELCERLEMSQSKVSRLMKRAFGPNPMKEYIACWLREGQQGFPDFLQCLEEETLKSLE